MGTMQWKLVKVSHTKFQLWNCLNELGLCYVPIWFKVRTVW